MTSLGFYFQKRGLTHLLLVVEGVDRDSVGDVALLVVGQQGLVLLASGRAQAPLHGQVPVVEGHDEVHAHVEAGPTPHVLLT